MRWSAAPLRQICVATVEILVVTKKYRNMSTQRLNVGFTRLRIKIEIRFVSTEHLLLESKWWKERCFRADCECDVRALGVTRAEKWTWKRMKWQSKMNRHFFRLCKVPKYQWKMGFALAFNMFITKLSTFFRSRSDQMSHQIIIIIH